MRSDDRVLHQIRRNAHSGVQGNARSCVAMTISERTSAMQATRDEAHVSDVPDDYLYRDPIERLHGLLGAIFILVSVFWLPTIYLLDSGLR